MKTSKYVLAMVAATMLAASCSNEIIETSDNQGQEISFQTVLGKQTRATETTKTVLDANGPIALAAYVDGAGTTTQFIPKQDLTFANGVWNFSSPIYSPGYALNYFAWHPSTATNLDAASTDAVATLAYTVPATTQDLIVAKATSSASSVSLQFSHILSQINFAIQGVLGVDVEITNLKVNGVKTTGTYNMSTSAWGIPTVPVSEPYTYTAMSGKGKTDGTIAMTYMGNGGTNFAANNALMLLPQTFAATTDGNFSFNYTLYKTGTSTSIATGTASANFSDFGVAAWAMGKRYVYIIDFTNYFGGPITFTVDVTAWADATPIYAQTLEVATATKAAIEAAINSHNTNATDLSKFPIYVDAAAAAITLKDFAYGNFTSADQVIISFKSGAASLVTLDSSLASTWAISYSTTVATLTKN